MSGRAGKQSGRRRVGRAGRLAAAVVVALASVVVPAAAAGEADAVVVCRTTDARLTELSGLAPSLRHPGVLWTHNDSGGGPTLVALDASTCAVRATVTLADTPARDLEGIATGRDADGVPTIWVGDIGDNRGTWPYVRLHAFAEPAVLADATLTGRTWRFTYEDGPADAEALLADPGREQLWVVTKRVGGGAVHAFPSPLPSVPPGGTLEQPLVLPRVGDAPAVVTDGAVAPDGSRWALRGYGAAVVRAGLPPGGEDLAFVDLPGQPQGETLAWAPDGRSWWTISERDDALWRVPLPSQAWPAPSGASSTPVPAGSPGSTGTSPPGRTSGAVDLGSSEAPTWAWALVVAACLLLAAFGYTLVRGLIGREPRP